MTKEEQVLDEPKTNKNKTAQTFEEVYPLKEPYVYAAVTTDPETLGLRYLVIEPTLIEEEKKALEKIKEILYQALDVDLKSLGSREDAEKWLREYIIKIVKAYKIKIEEGSLDKIQYYLVRDLIYFGKIDPLMYDHMIEDISSDGPGIPLYIWHRRYESVPTNILFPDESELDSFIIRLAYIAGKHISIANPMLDASLPDGSRIQLTYGREVTRKGSTFTIRRFRADPLTVTDLINFGTLNPEIAAWFWFIIERKSNILIGGGTASGKTTTLNSLSAFIPPDDKIVTIEDTAELNLPHENWISSVARTGFGSSGSEADISLFDLLKAAMRQRPEYVIVGEVRGKEAFTLFQAMATGHGGISSIHCDSAVSAFNRLETEPMNTPRPLLTILDTVVMLNKVRIGDQSSRRVTNIVEVVELDAVSKEIITNEVFKWNPKKDNFVYSGRSVLVDRIQRDFGLNKEYVSKELEKRKMLLEWMVSNNIRRYIDVGRVAREYYKNPEGIMEKVKLRLAA